MFYRPAKAYLNLPALRHNLGVAKQLAPKSKVLAIIKANGYGHGINRVAQQLTNADGFGVASIDEALTLRQKGFLHRILLLEGVFTQDELSLVVQNRLDLVIHSYHQLEWLLNFKTSSKINVWVKIDTGMHRLGFLMAQVPKVIMHLESSHTPFNIHLMSHLASADEQNKLSIEFTRTQIENFNAISSSYGFPKSLLNSAGLQAYADNGHQWIRPGILLYGAGKIKNTTLTVPKLKSVMCLKSEVIAIKKVLKGESVGYGSTWQPKKDSAIAVIAIGYGDGYPRHAKSGTPVLIQNLRVPLIGRVSMDMITVDITEHATVINHGDVVTLWGKNLPVDEIAGWADTVSYELLCGLTQRVPLLDVQ